MPLLPLLIIAAAYWGQTPACGQPTITRADLPAQIVGLAETDGCRITLDTRRFEAGEACQVTLHEYGHLIGLQHSLDPNNVMYPLMRRPRWPCAW